MKLNPSIEPYRIERCSSYACLKKTYESECKINDENSIWLFRGQSNADWTLKTTLERDLLRYKGNDKDCNEYLQKLLSEIDKDKDIYAYEYNLIREFKRKASIYTKTPKEELFLEWLSLMRHYEAPVRLLDCTYSFYVALYQAIKDKDIKNNCAIYAFNKKLFEDNMYDKIFKRKKITSLLRDSSFELDRYMNDFFNKNRAKGVINVTPFRHNVRIAIQQGSFLVPGNIKYTFMDNLEENIRLYGDIYKDDSFPVIKFILSCNSKERIKIIKDLYKMNITSHSLNPTLEGFCETLKVRFII